MNDINWTPKDLEVLENMKQSTRGMSTDDHFGKFFFIKNDNFFPISEKKFSFRAKKKTFKAQKRWTQAIGFQGVHLRIPYRFAKSPHNFPQGEFDHQSLVPPP